MDLLNTTLGPPETTADLEALEELWFNPTDPYDLSEVERLAPEILVTIRTHDILDITVTHPGFSRLPLRAVAKLATFNPAALRDHTHHVCFVNVFMDDVIADFLPRCANIVDIAYMQQWHYVQGILKPCKVLKVLVFLYSSQTALEDGQVQLEHIDDPRFVRLVIEDHLTDWETVCQSPILLYAPHTAPPIVPDHPPDPIPREAERGTPPPQQPTAQSMDHRALKKPREALACFVVTFVAVACLGRSVYYGLWASPGLDYEIALRPTGPSLLGIPTVTV
ncbi:hypothetical protein DFH08DRAFT_966146 [Mycena albidolilacea]|uniref:Uncharacterized protein n=1 Tax=Mycena albidolilacea TaxID=1033008 RepID=A0AAD7ELP8_9AGAR|nr:hypothetical protein DFH08DRAFT_966146 [Mycena albidolilacea]